MYSLAEKEYNILVYNSVNWCFVVYDDEAIQIIDVIIILTGLKMSGSTVALSWNQECL